MKIVFKIEAPSKETLVNYYNDFLFYTGNAVIFYEALSCGSFCHMIHASKMNQRRLNRIGPIH